MNHVSRVTSMVYRMTLCSSMCIHCCTFNGSPRNVGAALASHYRVIPNTTHAFVFVFSVCRNAMTYVSIHAYVARIFTFCSYSVVTEI